MSTPARKLFLGTFIVVLASCGGGASNDDGSPEAVAQQASSNAASYADLLDSMPLSESYKALLNTYDGDFNDYPDALMWSGGDYAPVNGSYYSYDQKNYPSANGIVKLFNSDVAMRELGFGDAATQGDDQNVVFWGIQNAVELGTASARVPIAIISEELVTDSGGVPLYIANRILIGFLVSFDLQDGPSYDGTPGSLFTGNLTILMKKPLAADFLGIAEGTVLGDSDVYLSRFGGGTPAPQPPQPEPPQPEPPQPEPPQPEPPQPEPPQPEPEPPLPEPEPEPPLPEPEPEPPLPEPEPPLPEPEPEPPLPEPEPEPPLPEPEPEPPLPEPEPPATGENADDTLSGARDLGQVSRIRFTSGKVFTDSSPEDLVDTYVFEAGDSGRYRINLGYLGPSYVGLALYEEGSEGDAPQLLDQAFPDGDDDFESVNLSIRQRLEEGRRYYIQITVDSDDDDAEQWMWIYDLLLRR